MRKTKAPSARNKLLSAIHAAARKNGLITREGDRSAYEDMLWTVARVPLTTNKDGRQTRSASSLDDFALHQVLDHLNAKPSNRWRAPFKKGTQQALMGVLWSKLAKAKLINDSGMLALRSWARKEAANFHETAELEFLPTPVLSKLIEQLKAWLERGQ